MKAESAEERQRSIYGARNIARLQRSMVGVAGLGLLGGAMSLQLGPLRIAQLLIDPDKIDAANLANQGFPADRVGELKVVVRKDQLIAQTPATRVSWLRSRVEDVGLGTLARVDLIITGLDSRISRVRVAEISQKLRLPWLDLACDGSGERLQGTVSYWDPRRADAPCHACRYDCDQLDAIR